MLEQPFDENRYFGCPSGIEAVVGDDAGISASIERRLQGSDMKAFLNAGAADETDIAWWCDPDVIRDSAIHRIEITGCHDEPLRVDAANEEFEHRETYQSHEKGPWQGMSRGRPRIGHTQTADDKSQHITT